MTNKYNLPEPTSPIAVVCGTINSETVTPSIGSKQQHCGIRVVDVDEEARPTKVAGCARCDRIEAHALGIEGLLGRRRDQLAKAREEIGQLKARISDLAAKPEPGPWLRGDELAAVMPTLKAGDVVEVRHRSYGEFSGSLNLASHSLALAGWPIRNGGGVGHAAIVALRIIEPAPAPEPGADIPDEVVEVAVNEWRQVTGTDREAMRAALAAADAKRAEVEEEA